MSNCGPESIQIQEYVNIKSGSKKLQFAPDKTSRLHIGRKRPEFKCENSYIDSWGSNRNENSDIYLGGVKVKEAFSTKYLGELISSDGSNTENIAARKKRGFGTIKDICTMLDKMCLGPYMFKKAVILRNSMLVGTLLTCSEAWYNVTEMDLGNLEQSDKALWCNLLEVARTVPYDLVCLELGLVPFRYIIMRRRLMYLQHILKQNEKSKVKQFFRTQNINPKKKDWARTINENLKHLELKYTLEDIENMPKQTYRKIISQKIS